MAVAKQALKKLEDQLTCAICLDAFKDPKLLQCFHVYCKDCLQRLVVQDRQGQLSLRCPTCRQSTLLPPATNVSDLQPAFHIHHLFEIQDALEKVKEPQKVQCEKCTRTSRTATKNQLSVVSKALEQLEMRCQQLNDQRAAIETNIQQQIQQLHELLEVRKAELISQLDQQIQMKIKNLAAQKDEVETVQTQLVSCLSFVRESLRTGSQGEVMKMKKAVMKQIKEMTDNFKPDMLPPCELANVEFIASPELTSNQTCCLPVSLLM